MFFSFYAYKSEFPQRNNLHGNQKHLLVHMVCLKIFLIFLEHFILVSHATEEPEVGAVEQNV